MNLDKIIDDAYQLYMPQVRSEITDLSRFVIENTPLKEGKPINILEIGTKFGGTFYIWNKINPDGMNISIDMSDGGQHGGILNEEMDQRDLWFNERFNNCHFIRGDSHENSTLAKLYQKLCFDLVEPDDRIIVTPWEKERIDFLFIDGDHTYEGVRQDFLNFEPLCKPKSIIAFHDIIISDQHHSRNVFVGEFWRELTKVRNSENPNQCIIDGNWYEVHKFIGSQEQTWAGIGVLIKL